MDFAFSESQQHWHDAAVRFAREELVEPEAGRATAAPRSGARAMPDAPGSASRGCPCPTSTAAGARTCPRPSRPWRAWATAAATRA